MPLDTGSTSESVMAVARIASTAVPPSASICSPACAASGWLVDTVFAARSGLRGQAYGFCHEKSVAAALMSMSGGFHVEDDAAEHFTRLQLLQGGVRVAPRPCFDRRRLDLLFLGERDDFSELLQVAYIRADDADGALRNRRERMRDLAAEQTADHVAAAFPERRDARNGRRGAADEVDRGGDAGKRLGRFGRAHVHCLLRARLQCSRQLRVVDIAADDVLHALRAQDGGAAPPEPATAEDGDAVLRSELWQLFRRAVRRHRGAGERGREGIVDAACVQKIFRMR